MVTDAEERLMKWPAQLVESMTSDAVLGLLLLRMRALVARGFEPGEALIIATRLRRMGM